MARCGALALLALLLTSCVRGGFEAPAKFARALVTIEVLAAVSGGFAAADFIPNLGERGVAIPAN